MSNSPDASRPASNFYTGILGAIVVAALVFQANQALRVERIDARVVVVEAASSLGATAKDMARLEGKVDSLERKLDRFFENERPTAAATGRK